MESGDLETIGDDAMRMSGVRVSVTEVGVNHLFRQHCRAGPRRPSWRAAAA